MSERLERILSEAIQSKRPILFNPTEDQIATTARELQRDGKLICTACRKPIMESVYATRQISLGPGLQAVAHLHGTCEPAFAAAMAEAVAEGPHKAGDPDEEEPEHA